ncbi:transposase [Streptomyces sp. NPDC101234]|uniref:transposase n=1 Tax=Streptomyces sp. NPDC101234 TaxID=3366138 RepID=UPI003811E810
MRPLRGTAKTAPTPPPKPQDVSAWITRHPGHLRAEEEQQLDDLLSRCPQLAGLRGHVHAFACMICDHTGADLPAWIRAVRAGELPYLHAFSDGLERDMDAVIAGLTLPWSSGPVEGHVNRIKMLKRQMYGRASLPLLRKRVLLARHSVTASRKSWLNQDLKPGKGKGGARRCWSKWWARVRAGS